MKLLIIFIKSQEFHGRKSFLGFLILTQVEIEVGSFMNINGVILKVSGLNMNLLKKDKLYKST
jgi:hypothetical protein